MRNIPISKVGELIQAVYNSEANLRIEGSWDAGFDYCFCDSYGNTLDVPHQVLALYRKIDHRKIEEVASLVLFEYELTYSVVDSNGEPNSVGRFIAKL